MCYWESTGNEIGTNDMISGTDDGSMELSWRSVNGS